MKKILSISLILVTALGFSACSGEEDDLFEASAAERLNAASALYSARLTAQPNGWAMQYYPTYDDEAPNGKGYLMLTRFNKDFTVDVSGYDWPEWRYEKPANADADASEEWICHYINEYREDTSFWEVITDNGPVLSFNSYNSAFHFFSDPDYRETGTGFGGDYEFVVVEAPEDASYMVLKGKKRGTYNLLTPVEEGIDYATYMADVKGFHNFIFPESELVSNLVHFGDTIYRMDGSNDGLPNIYPFDGDPVIYESFNPFLITKRGNDYYLRFRDAFERDDMDGELRELRYDSIQDKFIGVNNANFQITGYYQGRFLREKISSGSKPQLVAGEEVSELLNSYMTDVAASFAQIKDPKDRKKRSYGFVGLSFAYDGKEEKYVWNVIFRVPSSSANSTAAYIFEADITDNDVTMKYVGPFDESATNISNVIPKISELMNVLTQEYTISPVISNFDLSKLKLTSKTNPDLWFILNINK
jgi:hypothetical protein